MWVKIWVQNSFWQLHLQLWLEGWEKSLQQSLWLVDYKHAFRRQLEVWLAGVSSSQGMKNEVWLAVFFSNGGFKNANLCTKMAYDLATGKDPNREIPNDWYWIWRTRDLSKTQNFIWLHCHNIIACKSNLAHRGIPYQWSLCFLQSRWWNTSPHPSRLCCSEISLGDVLIFLGESYSRKTIWALWVQRDDRPVRENSSDKDLAFPWINRASLYGPNLKWLRCLPSSQRNDHQNVLGPILGLVIVHHLCISPEELIITTKMPPPKWDSSIVSTTARTIFATLSPLNCTYSSPQPK